MDDFALCYALNFVLRSVDLLLLEYFVESLGVSGEEGAVTEFDELEGNEVFVCAHIELKNFLGGSGRFKRGGKCSLRPGVERGTAYASVGANRAEHPRAQVTNAFRRRGYPVPTMRNVLLRHQLNMGGQHGYSDSIPEPFKSEVEA